MRAHRTKTVYRKPHSPLDQAAAWEVVWSRVAPVFEAVREKTGQCFVYFTGEEDGPLKIGSAKNPVARLRTLQTGNSRPLRIEHVLLGNAELERLLHKFWDPYAIHSRRKEIRESLSPGTEWFEGEIRKDLDPIVQAASKEQIKAAKTPDFTAYDMEQIARKAHAKQAVEERGKVYVFKPHGSYIIYPHY